MNQPTQNTSLWSAPEQRYSLPVRPRFHAHKPEQNGRCVVELGAVRAEDLAER